MKKATQIVLLIGLILIILISNLQSQGVNQKHPWWVNLGAGPALIGNNFGLTAGMIYSYQFEKSIISARMIGLTNINPTVQRIDKTTIKYKIADYGILYGPIWQSNYSILSIGAGIGLVRAAYEYPTHIATNTSISLPLEAQWFWRPTGFAGVGVYIHISYSLDKPFYGLMLCAQLGAWQ